MDRKLVGAGMVVALLTAAGCGTASKPLTRAEFVQRGNQICRRVTAEGSRQTMVAMSAARRRDKAAMTKALDAIGAQERQGLKDLGKLTPPKVLQASYAHYLSIEQAVSKIRALSLARFKQHENLPPAVNERGKNLVHQGLHIREALGLSDCTQY
jgi:hypothetical protein